MQKEEYLFKQYENILYWISHAESLLKYLITITTAVTSFIISFIALNPDVLVMSDLNYLKRMLLVICIGSLFSTYAFILRFVWAKHRSRPIELTNQEDLWFFGHVANLDYYDFRSKLEDWKPEIATASIQSQIYILSVHLKQRYDSLNLGYTSIIVAVASMLLFVISIMIL